MSVESRQPMFPGHQSDGPTKDRGITHMAAMNKPTTLSRWSFAVISGSLSTVKVATAHTWSGRPSTQVVRI